MSKSHNLRTANSLRTRQEIQRDYSMLCMNIGRLKTQLHDAKEAEKTIFGDIQEFLNGKSEEELRVPATAQALAILEMKLGDNASKVIFIPKDIENLFLKIERISKEPARPEPKAKSEDGTETPTLTAVPDATPDTAPAQDQAPEGVAHV